VWVVLTVPEFEEWMISLDPADQRALDVKIGALRQMGPALGRPHADTLEESKHPNMKELRARGTIRALYAFDPKRRAVLLIGGDKAGDKKFYARMIQRADDLFDEYLESLEGDQGS
jgi:hypothetical protein